MTTIEMTFLDGDVCDPVRNGGGIGVQISEQNGTDRIVLHLELAVAESLRDYLTEVLRERAEET